MERFATHVLAAHTSGAVVSSGRDEMRGPMVRCPACRRASSGLCASCTRSLKLGLAPLKTRELGATQLVREVRP